MVKQSIADHPINPLRTEISLNAKPLIGLQLVFQDRLNHFALRRAGVCDGFPQFA
jgi:hypothetical protein